MCCYVDRELKVQNESEFAMIKHRLLTQPTFLKVILRKEKKSGNTRYITKGENVCIAIDSADSHTAIPAI